MGPELSGHKTKIVCTIGPASKSPEILERMIEAGMNVARLNLSHGDSTSHAEKIANIRAASEATGRRVAILADLPGPKLRIGEIEGGPVTLEPGDPFTLTTEDRPGGRDGVSVTFARLTEVVEPGNVLSLSDGQIQLRVASVQATEVRCNVVAGGELRSRRGMNLPGIDLGESAFTEQDRARLEFAMKNGVDAVSQSFVSGPEDVEALRAAAREMGREPFVIAKIERASALDRIDDILTVADGIMVARGDLGVETPIERIAVTQKRLIDRAVSRWKPVITATHMLESMIDHGRPTRAEATDVANAILDGSDCVMLSGESAVGRFPVEATAMLARIAEATEPHRPPLQMRLRRGARAAGEREPSVVDLISDNVAHTLVRVRPRAVVVPTASGATARSVARFRLPMWVTAFSPSATTCQRLQFSYGVNPVLVDHDRHHWDDFTRDWLRQRGLTEGFVVLTEGPSLEHPDETHSMKILDLAHAPGRGGSD